MSGLGSGLSLLFKAGRKRIGNAIDNVLLDADAKKAIEAEVRSKFQPRIDRFSKSESKRADTIKELGDKLTESKKAFKNAQDKWQKDYDSALATAKNQRQTEIDNYHTELKRYQDAVDTAKTNKQNIVDHLSNLENINDPYRTIYTDVKSGNQYVLQPITNKYINITTLYPKLSSKEARELTNKIQNYETRLWDSKSNKVINVFDKSNQKTYGNSQYSAFDNYLQLREGQNAALIRDLSNADSKLKQANSDLSTWKSNPNRPKDWDDTTQGNNDLTKFEADFKANNGDLPTEYNFNGQTYSKESDLDQAYNQAVNHLQTRKNYFNRQVSKSLSERDAEIAKRIQDAKDIKKAKLALEAGAGAGALFAGARALYGGDDTDNGDNTNNIDNTDNIDTYTGETDPYLKLKNTPEGKTAYTGKPLVDTKGFDPDKAEAEAILAGAAYDKGVKDGNAIRSSSDLGNNIGATTRGHTMDDRLYELIKAMKDPYKADAIANYIYSRHGDDPEVQNLGWRGWLNKYYGDSLRSIMNIDPSGYKGMHISGGL